MFYGLPPMRSFELCTYFNCYRYYIKFVISSQCKDQRQGTARFLFVRVTSTFIKYRKFQTIYCAYLS